MSRILTAVSLLFACVIAVGAEQPVPDPQLRGRLAALRSSANPYQQLFSVPELSTPLPSASQPATVAPPKTRVVCGMTIVPAHPGGDPKMVLEPRRDGVDYKIRAIDPPICNPAR